MITKEDAVLNIIKASLWNVRNEELVINDEIKQELCKQSIDGLATVVIPESLNDKYLRAARYTQMLSVQENVISCIRRANIPVAVIKGTASGIYYPIPYLRKYGDIDILVRPNDYIKTIDILKKNDYLQSGTLGREVTTFKKNGYQIELHQRPPGLNRVQEGAFIHNYLISGLDNIEYASISQPNHTFPMLPWQQNGLELIWHIREHLYNGLGLRQIIDWMMFVYNCLNSDEIYGEYSEILKNAGLDKLAITVTRMCQLYLGLDNGITWCKNVDPEICRKLMEYILDQGNFGIKREDDKTVKVLTRYRNPISFFIGLQRKGLTEWDAAKKHVFLKPFAWIYAFAEGINQYTRQGGLQKILLDLRENKRRRELFNKLYEDEWEGKLTLPRKNISQ